MVVHPVRNQSVRLGKRDWLESALQVLTKSGYASMAIQNLCDALGVSRGSFYWHFKSRTDFINEMLEYWHEEYTAPVPDMVEIKGGTGEEKLLTLLTVVYQRDLVRYDIPIRTWASLDPVVARKVAKTDRFRLGYIRSLFTQMGFDNPEKEIRTRACMAYLLSEDILFDPMSKKSRLAEILDRHAFFVRP